MVNGEALYNSTNSVDFELHESEETELVLTILELAGISIKDPALYQQAAQEGCAAVHMDRRVPAGI